MDTLDEAWSPQLAKLSALPSSHVVSELAHTIEGLPAPTLDKHKPIGYPGKPKRE